MCVFKCVPRIRGWYEGELMRSVARLLNSLRKEAHSGLGRSINDSNISIDRDLCCWVNDIVRQSE